MANMTTKAMFEQMMSKMNDGLTAINTRMDSFEGRIAALEGAQTQQGQTPPPAKGKIPYTKADGTTIMATQKQISLWESKKHTPEEKAAWAEAHPTPAWVQAMPEDEKAFRKSAPYKAYKAMYDKQFTKDWVKGGGKAFAAQLRTKYAQACGIDITNEIARKVLYI